MVVLPSLRCCYLSSSLASANSSYANTMYVVFLFVYDAPGRFVASQISPLFYRPKPDISVEYRTFHNCYMVTLRQILFFFRMWVIHLFSWSNTLTHYRIRIIIRIRLKTCLVGFFLSLLTSIFKFCPKLFDFYFLFSIDLCFLACKSWYYIFENGHGIV